MKEKIIIVGISIIGLVSLLPFIKKDKLIKENNPNNYNTELAVNISEDGTNYSIVNEVPTSGYQLNNEKSVCKTQTEASGIENAPKDNNITIEYKEGKINFLGVTKQRTRCYLYFDKKDEEKPVISNVTTSVTKTEINVSVTATDNEGVTEYWYQLNSNTPVKGTGNTHKFTGLSAGTTYTVKVYVKDTAGNQSDTTTKSVQTTSNTSEDTLAKLNITNYKTTTPSFKNVATTDEGIYRVSDGMYGKYSYYWRGAVTNNYVKFGGFCWRIIRINGDGSIRLIYDGTTCHANGTSTVESIAKTNVVYNTLSSQSNYVGWTYTGTSQRTLSGTSSNAKKQLDSWYNSNLANQTSKIADGKYCNDRNVGTGGATTTWGITGLAFSYAAGTRRNDKSPSLVCNSEDVYSLKVGLITADEVMYAGGNEKSNGSYYLYNGQYYWTISPGGWQGGDAKVLYVSNNGASGGNPVTDAYGLRPVINLRSDVTFSGGNGTLDNPYVVQ